MIGTSLVLNQPKSLRQTSLKLDCISTNTLRQMGCLHIRHISTQQFLGLDPGESVGHFLLSSPENPEKRTRFCLRLTADGSHWLQARMCWQLGFGYDDS